MTRPTAVLWDPEIDYPSHEAMPDLDVVTHVAVERAREGHFHYLHETSLAWHRDRFWLGWANHPTHEVNEQDELIRGCTSQDGITWGERSVWVRTHDNGSDSYNHPVIASAFDKLWGFFTRWDNNVGSMDIFILDEASGQWRPTGHRLEHFIPFRPPTRMADGNWIIGGEEGWDEGAVAISRGDDWTQWQKVVLPRDPSLELRYPEVTLLERGDDLVAILRPKDTETAPVSRSTDCGRTWSTIELSNYPMGKSQPWCARLSTGQQYLLANHPVEGRTLLSIAVTEPGGDVFRRVWKVRHQATPKVRLLGHRTGTMVGKPTQWSYPSAVEHDGKLYVSYTHGKEDCALSIIPISALAI